MDPEPKKLNELFEAKKPSLLALPADVLLRPRISRERAARLTGILRRAFEPLLPLLPSELSASRAAERALDFEVLEPNQLIFYAADLAVETPWTSDQKARRSELVARVHKHDEILLGWAKPALRTNKDASLLLADIQRGRGIRDDADDTLRLVALFRSHWASVNGKIPISQADLETAETEATELLRSSTAAMTRPKGRRVICGGAPIRPGTARMPRSSTSAATSRDLIPRRPGGFRRSLPSVATTTRTRSRPRSPRPRRVAESRKATQDLTVLSREMVPGGGDHDARGLRMGVSLESRLSYRDIPFHDARLAFGEHSVRCSRARRDDFLCFVEARRAHEPEPCPVPRHEWTAGDQLAFLCVLREPRALPRLMIGYRARAL